jgi:chorismate mutase
MNKQILDLREELNEIDQKLGELLIRRFKICKEIGGCKKENKFPIEDLVREREIIDKRINQLDLPGEFVEELFLLIFKQSKRIQNGN